MAYTQAGLAIGHEDVGKPDRFIKKYGLPRGREGLSKSSLDSQYQVKRTLDAGVTNGGVGGLSEGVDLVVKKSAPRKNQICVLKRIGIRPDDHALLKREIELLHVLKHPNVVGFVDGYIPASLDGQAHLVMEYCDQGNLSDLIQNYVRRNKLNPHQPPAHIPEAFLWHVFESLASALAYIHYGVKGDDLRNPSVPLGKDKWPNILHRDVKPDNIFLQSSSFSGGAEPRPSGTRVPQFLSSRSISRLSSSASSGSASAGRNASSYPRVVLADFGVCTQEEEEDWNEEGYLVGTTHWMSPELPDMTARGEVWTVGAIMMSLCLLLMNGPIKNPPKGLDRRSQKQWYEKPESRRGVRDTYLGGHYSEGFRHTVRRTIRYANESRPKSHELLNDVRTSRAKAGSKFEPLPRWAFSKE